MGLFAATRFLFLLESGSEEVWISLTPLEPQSRFGDKLLGI